MALCRFTLNFRLTIQRKQKDKSGVPKRVTPCMQNAIPGKNRFTESQNKGTQNMWKKNIQAHLITLFLLKPLITSKILTRNETHPARHKEGRKHNTHSVIA